MNVTLDSGSPLVSLQQLLQRLSGPPGMTFVDLFLLLSLFYLYCSPCHWACVGGEPPAGVPLAVCVEAANVMDMGLELFYPTPESRAALLSGLVSNGGVVEVNFLWPLLQGEQVRHSA